MKILDAEKLSKNIEIRVTNDLKENNISGCSVLVKQNGNTLFKKHFGTLSAENAAPISDDTIFRLASMTKPITAVAAMIAVEKGVLDLDDEIEKYLPAFKDMFIIKLENGVAVKDRDVTIKPTVRHLLSHSSGIHSGIALEYYDPRTPAEAKKTLAGSVDYYAECGLETEPSQTFNYSPFAGFDIIARIIEIVSDMPYDEFLKKNIFEPCKMFDTGFIPSDDQWKRLIPMHSKENGKSVVKEMEEGCIFGDYPVQHFLGGAGLFSTVNDYSNFAEMLLNDGVFDGKQILSSDSISEMHTPQISEEIMPGSQQWGLSVRIVTKPEYINLPVGSYGWSGAYGTHFWVDPENKITAIYMKNSQYDGGSGAVTAANFETDVTNSFE